MRFCSALGIAVLPRLVHLDVPHVLDGADLDGGELARGGALAGGAVLETAGLVSAAPGVIPRRRQGYVEDPDIVPPNGKAASVVSCIRAVVEGHRFPVIPRM